MKLSKRQKAIILGMILGDAYLQKTGKQNARLRLEHSLKQKEYMDWKYAQLRNIFQSVPKVLQRMHPKTQKANHYVRLQSHASPVLGKMRRQFYTDDDRKQLPQQLDKVLASSLTIAVWYMDDGYYDKRDKSAHIYLQAFDQSDIERLLDVFRERYAIAAKAYCRPDRKACQLNFTGKDKDSLMTLINPYLIESMRYKTPLNPVTTESEK